MAGKNNIPIPQSKAATTAKSRTKHKSGMGAQAAAGDQLAAKKGKMAKTAQGNSSRPAPPPEHQSGQGQNKSALSGLKVMEANTEVDNKNINKKHSTFADDNELIPEDLKAPMPAAKKA